MDNMNNDCTLFLYLALCDLIPVNDLHPIDSTSISELFFLYRKGLLLSDDCLQYFIVDFYLCDHFVSKINLFQLYMNKICHMRQILTRAHDQVLFSLT